MHASTADKYHLVITHCCSGQQRNCAASLECGDHFIIDPRAKEKKVANSRDRLCGRSLLSSGAGRGKRNENGCHEASFKTTLFGHLYSVLLRYQHIWACISFLPWYQHLTAAAALVECLMLAPVSTAPSNTTWQPLGERVLEALPPSLSENVRDLLRRKLRQGHGPVIYDAHMLPQCRQVVDLRPCGTPSCHCVRFPPLPPRRWR